MALTLRIENETSLPDGGPLSIRVTGRRGIDIGRDPHLDWTLPDPSRFVSGKHCEVRFQDGDYVLYDVSKNGTFINGSDRRVQGPHRLRQGDRLLIGNYIIAVDVEQSDQISARAVAPKPAASAEFWSAEDAAPPAARGEVMPARQNKPVQPDFLDWAMDVPAPIEPRRPTFDPPPPAAPPPPPAAARGPAPGGDAARAWPAAPAGNPFLDPPPAARMPGGGNPFLDGPADPFAPAAPSAPSAAAARSAWDDPEPVRRPEPLRPSAPESDSAPVRKSVWVDTRPVDPPPESVAVAPPQSDFSAARVALTPSTPPQPMMGAAASGPGPSEALALIARGAGLPDQALGRRDPAQTLTEIGEVLRVMTENMMRLLAARSESKRAIRSTDHTMMGAVDNNPLKFSPTVEDALTIVLGPPMRSYLSGSDAVSEGFDDLVNHQMRIFAAMQQAMKMLLEDLDPALIDKSVEEDRGVASFLGSRKTRLWDQYVTRWQAKAGRNDNGMAGVFMLYFAECYDRLGDRGR